MSYTATITFSNTIENHKGMEIIGNDCDEVYELEDLQEIKSRYEKDRKICELVSLNEYLPQKLERSRPGDAYLLVIRDALGVDKDEIFQEQLSLELDKKAYMYGRVVNKNARWNICIADFSQEPDYEKGKGRVVDFKNLPKLSNLRESLGNYLGDKGKNLLAEGNYYYDISKCFIGWHGDTERKKVVGCRLGASFPIRFNWFYKSEPVGKTFEIVLNGGDIYIMSRKAVGTDWKKSNIYTLRHSASLQKIPFNK